MCFALFFVNTAQAQDPIAANSKIEFNASFDGELWRNLQGGVTRGNRFLDHSLLSMAVNGEAAFGVPGLSLYGATLFTNGASVNELVGAVQGISNIEAPLALRLYEAWADWLYGDDHNSLRFGLYDVNSEFDAIETGALFINPSHGIGPDFSQSGANGPSIFPVTSLGLRSWHQRGPWVLQLAVLDGVPGDPQHETRTSIRFDHNDGVLLLAETGVASAAGVRAALGYWRYTAKFDDLLSTDDLGAPLQRDDNHGYYGLVDVRLMGEVEAPHRLNGYVRYGRANANINATSRYTGAGLVLSGTLPGRSADQLGIAIGVATASKWHRAALAAQALDSASEERLIELTYLLPVTSWLSLQPDIQHVEHAGFDASVRSAWVIGLRFELTAGWRQ